MTIGFNPFIQKQAPLFVKTYTANGSRKYVNSNLICSIEDDRANSGNIKIEYQPNSANSLIVHKTYLAESELGKLIDTQA